MIKPVPYYSDCSTVSTHTAIVKPSYVASSMPSVSPLLGRFIRWLVHFTHLTTSRSVFISTMTPLPSVSSLLPRSRKGSPRFCSDCTTSTTPQWRYSEDGRLLCNSCGIRSRRKPRSGSRRLRRFGNRFARNGAISKRTHAALLREGDASALLDSLSIDHSALWSLFVSQTPPGKSLILSSTEKTPSLFNMNSPPNSSNSCTSSAEPVTKSVPPLSSISIRSLLNDDTQ